MALRIQVVVDPTERDEFLAQATREGRSLSEWMRLAARERLAGSTPPRLETSEDLKRFFKACDQREEGVEPDWDEHLAAILESVRGGLPQT